MGTSKNLSNRDSGADRTSCVQASAGMARFQKACFSQRILKLNINIGRADPHQVCAGDIEAVRREADASGVGGYAGKSGWHHGQSGLHRRIRSWRKPPLLRWWRRALSRFDTVVHSSCLQRVCPRGNLQKRSSDRGSSCRRREEMQMRLPALRCKASAARRQHENPFEKAT